MTDARGLIAAPALLSPLTRPQARRRTRTPASLSLLSAIGFLLPLTALAQSAPPANPTCAAGEHRQFDFWKGDWEVMVDGKLAGTNSISTTLDGCVLHEHWAGSRGHKGESFNYYDRQDGRWHQLWVDDTGGTLQLVGGFQDRKMVLIGDGKDPQGKPIQNRITWTPQPDGSVRQLWDTSSDAGKTWQIAFDGLYRKRSAAKK